jgi:hypothetical protein
MTSFRFRLEKVLALRHTQLELAEARYRQQVQAMAELDRQQAAWDSAASGAEKQVRAWSPLDGSDLTALGAFRIHVVAQKKQLASRREEQQRRVDAHQKAAVEARRASELLERLKERRLAEWKEAAARELEELAAESYMASVSRARS